MDKEFRCQSTKGPSVLIVGDGDFSFSVAFTSRYSAVKLTATTLETEQLMLSKYPNFAANQSYLHDKGVTVCTGVDATRLHDHFRSEQFTHILFNFPHVGGKSNIKKNRQLLDEFFQSAVDHITECGKVFVTLCKGQGGTGADNPCREWCNSWQVTAKAANSGLLLTAVDEFEGKAMFDDYLSTGFRSQNKRFHTEGSLVHKFIKSLPIPPPLDSHHPSQWLTESNLLQDLIDSLMQSWSLFPAREDKSSKDMTHYTEFYCPKTARYTFNERNCQKAICYSDKFCLHKDKDKIVLAAAKGRQLTVGAVTAGGLLEISLYDILKEIHCTDDSRYFTNRQLIPSEASLQAPCEYSLVIKTAMSVYPPEYKFDISFWIPDVGYTTGHFQSLVYDISNHLVRDVTLLDTYIDSGRTSHCYNIVYQSLDSALSVSNAYMYYQQLRCSAASKLNVTLR